MIDNYFKRPLFWDYFLAFVLVVITKLLCHFEVIFSPPIDTIKGIVADISMISFTSAGFILTLATVLITFKSNSKATKNNYNSTNSLFELFFASGLYYETIKHLSNCIKSLVVLSVLGYILRLLAHQHDELLFIFCILGVVIIGFTLWRCLLILTKILNLQKENEE
jgi:hypothetical protein